MYKNHVEYFREASDCKKNIQEKLGNITAERDYFEKSAILPRFEQGSPIHIKDSPRDGTAVFELFGGTVHTRGLGKRTR